MMLLEEAYPGIYVQNQGMVVETLKKLLIREYIIRLLKINGLLYRVMNDNGKILDTRFFTVVECQEFGA